MTIKTNFTPGPWEYVKLSHGSVYIRSLRHGVDGYLADVFLSRPGECNANARLIAAAPDLLESLTNLVGLAKLGAAHLDKYHAALSDAEAALAKARGES